MVAPLNFVSSNPAGPVRVAETDAIGFEDELTNEIRRLLVEKADKPFLNKPKRKKDIKRKVVYLKTGEDDKNPYKNIHHTHITKEKKNTFYNEVNP